MGRAESASALSPPLPRDPEPLLLPKRLQARAMPRSSPFPYLSLSQPCKQIPVLRGMCTRGFQSHHLLTAALSGSGVRCSQSPYSGSGSHVPRCTGSQCPRGWSPEGHASQRETLPPGAGFHPCRV